ncbi:hypothetical protein Ga0100230_021380 [Opitutaceae bacterium TAV3]|nr:hypothetical protein Ga0100230_021380 [Opitutaceae bacterium TAV3]
MKPGTCVARIFVAGAVLLLAAPQQADAAKWWKRPKDKTPSTETSETKAAAADAPALDVGRSTLDVGHSAQPPPPPPPRR